MADKLDVYLNYYPAQHVNCMSANSKFVTFVSHTINFAVDLAVFPTVRAVLSTLLETQDANASFVQIIHKYHNKCYNEKCRDYMERLEHIAERPK